MAGRIRSIKPEFIEDEKLGAMNPTARLLFACSWLLADDYGNFRANPKWVHSQVFFNDDTTDVGAVREALATLSDGGMLMPYSVRGQSYYHVTNWHHQRVDKPGKPHCPGPEEAEEMPQKSECGINSRESRETVARVTRDSSESHVPDRDLDQDLDQEGKGSREARPEPPPPPNRFAKLGAEIAKIEVPKPIPTRRERAASDLMACPASELAARCRANPHDASLTDLESRPDVSAVNAAWAKAVGITFRRLGCYSDRNKPLQSILDALAVASLEDVLRACNQASRDDWCRGLKGSDRDPARKRDVGCLSPTVLRRLLDAADAARPSSVNPRVAAMLAEERKRMGQTA